MTTAPVVGAAADAAAGTAGRRRRFGLALVALGVLAIALQTLFEWLLPYDFAGLAALRRQLGRPGLSATTLTWAWALSSCSLLAALAWRPRAAQPLGLLAGLVLGSVYLAAGGSAAALALLLLVGVASLGWHGRGQGGLTLLLGTALAIAIWDALLSAYPTAWMAAIALVGMFAWIDRQHIRANDRRLLDALAERDALIRDLDARGEQLQLVQDARTRLLASISHDLRQPLQAVRLYAEALASRPQTDARGRELLRQQMHAADDAVAMLDQFSEFSAIEHGMLVSHPELVNLRDVLDRVAATLQATHPRERLVVRVHGRRDASWAWIDRSQVARVVQNLAGNAARYSVGVPASGAARVVLAVRPHGGGLALDVVDNGRGIPADKIELVFEPYVQLPLAPADRTTSAAAGPREPEAARAGRGLGLAIVRGLAAQIGLAIAPVRSRVGHGTRFRVVLPDALRRAPPAAAPAAGSPAPGRLDGWLIALLDDEEAPRAALRAALEGRGATIVEAASLAALKPKLDEEARFPDVLVFDLDLGPGEPDGRVAMTELRQEWDLVVPAVIVTGRVGSRSVMLPQRCSLHEKPVALDELVATLQRIAPRPPTP